jgi:hypothetical protein
MSQDFDIRTTNKDGLDANGPGLKQVLYGNFLALVTQFAGETAPADTYQGMPWLDISEGWTNAKMKFWNGSEWVLQNEYNPYIKDLRVSRGTKNTLWERLEVALNEDGTIKSDLAENMTEWIDSTLSATYVSADTFTVPGDYTDVFVTNRKIKATLDASSVYSAVESANYDGVNDETTIVLFDTVIDATIQKVEYGLVKAGPDGSNPENNLIDETTGDIYEFKMVDGSLAMEVR